MAKKKQSSAANELEVLIDASVMGDQAAAERHGIHRTTVCKYRRNLVDNKEKREAFTTALNSARVQDVEDVLESALRTAIDQLQFAVQRVEPTAIGLEAITNATRTLAEIHFGIKMIKARVDAITQANRSAGAGTRSLAGRPAAAA